MERDLMARLDAWRESARRKPLMLNGARQVGKTWLLQELGRTRFRNMAYVNFDGDAQLAALFDQDYDVRRLVTALQAATRQRIVPGETLLVLDEVQECPRAITSLKYFCEELPGLAVAAAGSLLGVTLHGGTGFPVGKVNVVDLHPMTFLEFLGAVGEGMTRELLESGDRASIGAMSARLSTLLKEYCLVGGMPEAVAAFASTGDIAEARAVQREVLYGYERDVSKHLAPREAEHVLAAWASIPAHLGRESKRFVFGHIRDGARARDYRSAITWMSRAGVATVVPRVSKAGVPLRAYAEERAFKLFCVDVGLLGAMAGLDERSVVEGNSVYTEFKGALTEQYVCQELVALGLDPFYWSAENSSGEIDFIVQRGPSVYPIEVKAEENLRARSLRAFGKRYPEARCRRFSLSGFRDEGWMVNVPLYCVGVPGSWE